MYVRVGVSPEFPCGTSWRAIPGNSLLFCFVYTVNLDRTRYRDVLIRLGGTWEEVLHEGHLAVNPPLI